MGAIITWAALGVCALMFLAWVVVPVIALIAEALDGSPRRREAQITRRIVDAHSEVSAAFAAARDKMTRRAGLDDSFRLRSGSRSRW